MEAWHPAHASLPTYLCPPAGCEEAARPEDAWFKARGGDSARGEKQLTHNTATTVAQLGKVSPPEQPKGLKDRRPKKVSRDS
jgi:hypothetical protein